MIEVDIQYQDDEDFTRITSMYFIVVPRLGELVYLIPGPVQSGMRSFTVIEIQHEPVRYKTEAPYMKVTLVRTVI